MTGGGASNPVVVIKNRNGKALGEGQKAIRLNVDAP